MIYDFLQKTVVFTQVLLQLWIIKEFFVKLLKTQHFFKTCLQVLVLFMDRIRSDQRHFIEYKGNRLYSYTTCPFFHRFSTNICIKQKRGFYL
jgi:hypothetical protein